MTTPKVLIVEDDDIYGDRLARFLTRFGCDVDLVKTAGDGEAVVQRGLYDCVVVDYRLPGPDGLDFVRAIRKIDDKVGAVMITGHDASEIEKKCEGLRVWSVLEKPFDMMDFAEKVKEASELTHLSPEREDELAQAFGHEATRMREIRQDLLRETRKEPPPALVL